MGFAHALELKAADASSRDAELKADVNLRSSMLPRRSKVSRAHFLEASTKARVYHFPLYTARFLPVSTLPKSRAAVVVSKKVAARAVDRNKIKRRTYNILRSVLPSLPTGTLLIFVKKEAVAKSFQELEREISSLSLKIK